MEEIPANCVLSKGTTGCGATTLATEQRTPTIIAAPFVELIGNKAAQYPENDSGRPVLLPIYGEGDKTKEIAEYMSRHGDLPKIMTTYDSVPKVCGILTQSAVDEKGALLGAVVGMLSAAKGVVGVVFSGITDIFAILPRLVMLIVLSAFLQGSSASLILLISVFGWAGTAREVRAKVVHVRALPFVETCKMYGYGRVHTAVRHILPNVSDVLLSRFLVGVTTCIMTESTMSFLGFGDLYYPTWGVMIDFARSRGALIAGAYQYLLAPCVCIMLLALSFYLISLYIEKRREVVSPAVFNR